MKSSADGPKAAANLRTLEKYRREAARGSPTPKRTREARKGLLQLGGDPIRSSASLKHYDHRRFGPFLGVSDEGSAAKALREAAYDSPKVRALPRSLQRSPLTIGLALDAERLGGVGETAPGPEEYADVWLGCIDRLLITTNVGTRVNLRVYRREPIVLLKGTSSAALAAAKTQIAAAFKPFIETPDKRPRPLTVFVDIPRYIAVTRARKLRALKKLVKHVSAIRAIPAQQLGLSVCVKLGEPGRDESLAAIELGADAGMKTVMIEGVKRREAHRAISLGGLLDYFRPGHVGPILRAAKRRGVTLRTGNLPDTDTMARSTWVGLTTARNFGANLGKYGCFPLTLNETDRVVELVQQWLPDWSAAPVFFVDQGILRDGAVDVGSDLMRGLTAWLRVVAKHEVRVVLIDTVDKAAGYRLLKSANDTKGFLGWRQIKKVEALARELRIKVLWAGGLGLPDAYEMGKLGVFGIYVTTAAATTIAVHGSYERDPSLAGLKEPSREAVLRTKILLEAGFLRAHLAAKAGARIEALAQSLLAAHREKKSTQEVTLQTKRLGEACFSGWRVYWKKKPG